MRFTRLRISGFKSFVEPTELHIEPGLTGIVGPNGCGKSNLVEALGWVMGEGSAKKMRAKGMDDVIFGGAAGRPARNMAEVALFVDNTERTAPAAFNDSDALEISRRIEREAGSVYRINSREARARDVLLLFADAASGPHSTALVRQGRIGALIDAKPADRRAILEEAAGIGGLHSRRHEAELRLRAAENNLTRLDDVMAQIEGQLAALKRQARQASRYRNLSGHIRRSEALLFYLRWSEATEMAEQAAAMLDATESKVGQAAGEAASASNAQLKASEAVPPLRQAEAEASAIVQRLSVARDGVQAESERLAAQTARIDTMLAQTNQDVAREHALVADSDAAFERLAEERRTRTAALAELDGADTGLRAELSEAQTTLSQNEQAFDEANRRLAEITARRGSLRRELEQSGRKIEELVKRESANADAREKVETELAGLPAVHLTSEASAAARSALEAARASLVQAESERAQAQNLANSARDAHHSAREAVGRIAAEETALSKLLQDGEQDLWPPLVDALVVEPGYETALGAALGDDLNYPADEAAPVHWAVLQDGAPLPALPAGADPLDQHVKGAAALSRRLSQIGVVDSADGAALQAGLLPGQRLVSLEGALWRWDGFTAVADAPTAAARRLEMRNRLAELEADRREADLVATRAAEQDEHAAGEARNAAERETARRKEVQAAEQALTVALDAQAKAERASTALAGRRDSLAENATRLAEEIAEVRSQQAAAQQTFSEMESEDAQRTIVERCQAAVTQHRASLSAAQSALDTHERTAKANNERLQALEAEEQACAARKQDAERQSEVLQTRARELSDELAELQQQPDILKEKFVNILNEITQAEAQRTEAANALAAAELHLAECDKHARETQNILADLREERAGHQVACQGARARVEDVVEQIAERLNCKPEETLALAELKDETLLPEREAVERDLARFKRERENMGAVNLRADEEAQEKREQLDGMIREREDLEGAIARLRQAISSLNREGRERLLAAFEQVNAHFTRLFTHLFGGGHARLELVESDDPLEAGLEILASPPGKRLQSMSLLSGGEQALTAMSLIFAVFLSNPSPICVLDEVDAPLDDANVERFCNLLEEMTRLTETRFLVVTHNAVTMSRMDRLFGVTMAEKGVSQLVSVDLERAERLRAVG